MRRLRMGRWWRAATLMVIAGVALTALGARCIERTYVYVDDEGYTHITGEMVNDTNIQGSSILLQGTLYDGNNNVIATKTAPTCPPTLDPQTQVVFDIRFDNPNVPPHARYEVRPISGQALEVANPDPDVVLFFADAFRFEGVPPIPGIPFDDRSVFFFFNARNRSQQTYLVQGCAAVYDQQGRVVKVESTELIEETATGIAPASMEPSTQPGTVFLVANDVPAGPVQARAWLWFGPKGAPASQWKYVSTGLITIKTENLFP
jgi:hypothetical protein